MMRKRILFVAVALITLLAIGVSMVYGQELLMGRGHYARTVAGSWFVTAIPDPATGFPPMVSYSAMTRDGRMIGSGATGLATIGEWQRSGGSQFATTFKGYEVYEGQIIHNNVRAVLQLSRDGEEFSGPFVNEVSDVDGNVLFAIGGTVQGTRMHVEPLD